VDLEIQPSNIPVGDAIKCKQVQGFVIDAPMPVEVLLGNQLLKQLGIDIDAQLFNIAIKNMKVREESHPLDPTAQRTVGDFNDLKSSANPDGTPQSSHDSTECHDFQSDEDLDLSIKKLMERALKNGLPRQHKRRLEKIVEKYDIWRTKLEKDPPAKVPPMEIKLKKDTPIIHAKSRRYPPLYQKFLKQRFNQLEELGYVYKNNKARFSSAVHVVPKTNSTIESADDLRYTADLKNINKWVEPTAWPMPNLEVVLEHLKGARFFAAFDLLKGYWQCPLHPNSQEILSLMTDEGIYTPTRIIQGFIDAVKYFQSTMQGCFREILYISLIIWIDDILVYAKTEEDLLRAIEEVFDILNKFGLKLNPNKCELFKTDIKFCGKMIDQHGIRHDPERIRSIIDMELPTTAKQLNQYLCATNWMRNAIPDYSRKAKSLRIFLESVCVGVKRTNKALKHVQITMNTEIEKQFRDLNIAIANVVSLSHPDPEAEYFLFTDACDAGWGAALFQIKQYDPNVPVKDQNCEPLYFLSGAFSGAMLRWSMPEKEGFAMVESVERLDYLLIRSKPFYLMTDHRNHTFVFSDNLSLKAATRHKISRWALQLMSFNYIIIHVPGEQNEWADLLSRWAQPKEILHMRYMPLHPYAEEDTTTRMPSVNEIIESQKNAKVDLETRPELKWAKHESQDIIQMHDKIWIPETDEDLFLRICVIAHGGLAGHRGVASTTRIVSKYCATIGLRSKINKFIKSCLLCLQSKGGKTIPRPLGRSIQAESPNEVLHFDHVHLGEAYNGWTGLLVLKDGLTHFCELQGGASKTAEATTETLLDWFKRFGIVRVLVSDQPSHFKNEVLAILAHKFHLNHHFISAYCPWANGTIERLNRTIIELFKLILAELKLPFDKWPLVIPHVQYVLNNTPTESLHGYAPIQIFQGREAGNMLSTIFDPVTKTYFTTPQSGEDLDRKYTDLKDALSEMHQQVRTTSDEIHNRNKKKYAKLKQADFEIGDFVLWSREADQKHHHKLQFVWRGPFRVVKCKSNHLFDIQHLRTLEVHEVHAIRLKYYTDNSFNVTTELLSHIDRQGFLYQIKKLNDLQWNKDLKRWEVQVQWSGLEETENSWEPIANLLEDIPVMIYHHLQQLSKKTIRQLKAKFSSKLAIISKKYNLPEL
jgi:hypothetical protein